MRLAFRFFLLGLLLTGCVSSQSMPTPTATIYKPIVSTATVLATPTTILPTPTLTPTPAYREIKVSFTREYTLLEGFLEHPHSFVWSADGKTLIIASKPNYLVYFDTQSNTATIKPVEDWAISTIALSSNSKILAVNSDSRFIESASASFINLETGEIIRTIRVDKPFIFEGQTRIVYGNEGIFSPDGRTFILNSGKEVTLWDVASGESKELYKSDSNSLITDLFLNSGKNLLFARQCKIGECSNEATFLRWDTNSWELTKTFTGDFFGFLFSPDGDTFTPIYKNINIVHSNNATELFNFTGSHNLGIYNGRLIAYDPSGKYIAIGNTGYTVVYEAHTGTLVRWLFGFDPESLKFSPDGTKLAAGGGSERPGMVAIWDLTRP